MIVTPGSNSSTQADTLERVTVKAPLTLMNALITDTRSAQGWYSNRNRQADWWWHAIWDYQSVDGKKWGASEDDDTIWPWRGASDTRDRTVDMIVKEYLTVQMFAVSNMKAQLKSTRPAASMRSSQQGTTLLNWMIFSHMSADMDLEVPLAINWRNARGAAIMWVDWEQERRIERYHINIDQFQQALGVPPEMIVSWFTDPKAQDMLVKLVQQLSPIISKSDAKGIIETLKKGGIADIPMPYVYVSKPRLTALRPYIDILFDENLDQIQRAAWMARPELISEVDLTDRIETMGYDEQFVKKAITFKGKTTSAEYRPMRYGGIQQITPSTPQEMKDKILIYHFYHKTLDEGVPDVYCTVFHEGVDIPAKYEPYGYKHGEYPAHVLRFEKHERPILSSRGICEIAYTWEQEMKTQRDGRANRTELELRPPLMAPYQDVLRLKSEFAPGIVMGERHSGNFRWFETPPMPVGSIELEAAVMRKCDRYFGLFGAEVDPALKQLRQQEAGDSILKEFKPIHRQIFKLMQEYLPNDTAERVAGPMQRPFQVSREEIQGEFEYSATVDMRDLDPDFLKQKLGFYAQLAQLDTMGVLDKVVLVKSAAESIDYSLADMAVTQEQQATNKEISDENAAIDRILGSGRDQELPMGANYQLRKQTLDTAMQDIMQNPAAKKNIDDNPLKLKVLQTRMEFFDRQLQQQQNAQIGRMQVTKTFSKDAPQPMLGPGEGSGGAPMNAMGMMGGQQ